MINKIRRRFILVAMIAVTIVLTVIISGIFLVSKKNLCNYSDMVLESLAENGGRFPENFRGEGAPNKYLGIGLSSETPFETRYFYVKYDADGNCKSFYLDKIATVGILRQGISEKILFGFRRRIPLSRLRYAGRRKTFAVYGLQQTYKYVKNVFPFVSGIQCERSCGCVYTYVVVFKKSRTTHCKIL